MFHFSLMLYLLSPKSLTLWLPARMPVMTMTRMTCSQELKTLFQYPMWLMGVQLLRPSASCYVSSKLNLSMELECRSRCSDTGRRKLNCWVSHCRDTHLFHCWNSWEGQEPMAMSEGLVLLPHGRDQAVCVECNERGYLFNFAIFIGV